MELLKVKVDGQWVEVPSIKGEKGEKGDAFTYADFTEAQKMALIQGPIKTAQDAAVDVVEDAGSDQVAAVEAKGEEVRESIPSDYTELSENVSALNSALLLLDDIPDTVQTLQRNEAGKVSGIVHTSTAAGGGVVRTDSYVFSDSAVVETRTLASGESLTITVNKATKVTTLVYAAA